VGSERGAVLRDKKVNRIPRFEFESLESSALGKSYEGVDGEGVVYLIQSSSLSSYKIGITSPLSSSNRISQHKKNGWNLIEIYKTSSMQSAFEIEQAVISWWRRELRLWQSVESEDMPQGGSTETVGSNFLTIENLISYVEQLVQNQFQELKWYSEMLNPTVGSLVKFTGDVVSSRLDAQDFDGMPKRTKNSRPAKIKRPIIRATVANNGKQFLLEKHLYRITYTEQSKNYKDSFLIFEGQRLEVKGRVFPINENREMLGLLNPQTFEVNQLGQPLIDSRPNVERLRARNCSCGGIYGLKFKRKNLIKSTFWECETCGNRLEEGMSLLLSCGTCMKGHFGVDSRIGRYRCGYCNLELDSAHSHIFGEPVESKVRQLDAYKPIKTRAEWEERHGPIRRLNTDEDNQIEYVDPDSLPEY
jgi:hypothetical protein